MPEWKTVKAFLQGALYMLLWMWACACIGWFAADYIPWTPFKP